ncbi:Transcription factor [Coemansia sp. RSA 2599]|nr:Transcription factor [Coemansia sp. RSA 2599]
MSCDDKRPCQRCIKRHIAHMCRDKEPATETSGSNSKDAAAAAASVKPKQKPRAKAKTKAEKKTRADPLEARATKAAVPIAPAISSGDASGNDGGGDNAGAENTGVASAAATATAVTAAPTKTAATPGIGVSGNAGLNSNTLLLFGNDVASNEFSALNEFLESLQRGVRGGERFDTDLRLSNPPSSSPSGPPTRPAVGSPAVEAFSIPAPAHVQQTYTGTRALSLPTISQLMAGSGGEGVTQAERFLLTAADPNDGTSEDKLRQIINAKYEAGILKPYNYVGGYTRMQRFMEAHVSRASIMRIIEVLNTFRPTFRSIAQALTDIDLLLVEEGFERLLLDYDNVFNSFGVPACLWRRTGEIYKANREFADLVGVPLSYFHEGRVCIYELMSETSTVNYWEKYGEIAFDATQKAVLTTCVLQTAASVRSMVQASRAAPHSQQQQQQQQPGAQTRCCFSFTLRRDKYKIPLAIAGNFMPIQQQPQK